jgi:pimeloyl-ACP methyl ester carboxylesterase
MTAGPALAAALAVLAAGCASPVIDPDDPLESSGDRRVAVTRAEIPNPEDGETPLSASLYLPLPPGGAAAQRSPLVLLLPGFGVGHRVYRPYAEHLASHGIAVLAMDYASSGPGLDGQHDYKARQVLYALDYALAHPRWSHRLDPDRLGAVGHSLGGKLAFYAAALDPRLALVAALDPVNAGGAPCEVSPEWCAAYPVAPNPVRGQTGMLGQVQAASLIFRSAPDPLLNPEAEFNAALFFQGSDGQGLDAVPAPALYLDMDGVSHAAYLPALGGATPQVVKRTLLAWIRRHFYGEDLSEYLTGARIEADIGAGRVQAVTARD